MTLSTSKYLKVKLRNYTWCTIFNILELLKKKEMGMARDKYFRVDMKQVADDRHGKTDMRCTFCALCTGGSEVYGLGLIVVADLATGHVSRWNSRAIWVGSTDVSILTAALTLNSIATWVYMIRVLRALQLQDSTHKDKPLIDIHDTYQPRYNQHTNVNMSSSKLSLNIGEPSKWGKFSKNLHRKEGSHKSVWPLCNYWSTTRTYRAKLFIANTVVHV